MPASSNNTTIKVYGTNTPSRIPTVGTLGQRELFVNTYNTYSVETVVISNGGVGYTLSDVGRVGTVMLTGVTEIHPLRVIIQDVTGGAVSAVGIIDYGGYSAIPSVLTGALSVPSSSGTGAIIQTTFFPNPAIEVGGGLFVGDATQVNETVQLTGSLASQDHTMVNITGGNISNVTLNGVTLTSGAGAPTVLTNATLNTPAITGGTITGATITGGSVGTSGSAVPTAYITSLHVPNAPLPSGVTSVGVLVLGSDGIVYVTQNPIVTSLTASGFVKSQALAVGNGINGALVPAGAIQAQADITAFTPVV